jgi:RNA polymerase sigma-70 factor (ECF subfamily)
MGLFAAAPLKVTRRTKNKAALERRPAAIVVRVKSRREPPPPLRLVTDTAPAAPVALLREVDWAILMARAQGGDRVAYRRLLQEITPYVRSLAAAAHREPHDVEDAVQDVLLCVHAIRHTYDPARPFGPWLVAIARRRIVDRLRRQGRTRRHETPLEEEHETFGVDETNYAEEGADAEVARQAVERLPAAQREAIQLMKLQELSLRQASAASGMTVAALKVATHRGLKALRKLLAGTSEKG